MAMHEGGYRSRYCQCGGVGPVGGIGSLFNCK